MNKVTMKYFFSLFLLLVNSAAFVSCRDKVANKYETEISDDLINECKTDTIFDLSKAFTLPLFKLADKESFTIEYIDGGCFHYQRETIIVRKSSQGYLYSASNYVAGKDTQVISESLIPSSFASRLKQFDAFCTKNISKKTDDTIRKSIYSTNFRGIRIQANMDTIWIPIEDSYYSLFKQFNIRNTYSSTFNGS